MNIQPLTDEDTKQALREGYHFPQGVTPSGNETNSELISLICEAMGWDTFLDYYRFPVEECPLPLRESEKVRLNRHNQYYIVISVDTQPDINGNDPDGEQHYFWVTLGNKTYYWLDDPIVSFHAIDLDRNQLLWIAEDVIPDKKNQ